MLYGSKHIPIISNYRLYIVTIQLPYDLTFITIDSSMFKSDIEFRIKSGSMDKRDVMTKLY